MCAVAVACTQPAHHAPEPSVSKRSNASRISCFCSSVSSGLPPLPLARAGGAARGGMAAAGHARDAAEAKRCSGRGFDGKKTGARRLANNRAGADGGRIRQRDVRNATTQGRRASGSGGAKARRLRQARRVA